jgi:adenylyltransferase/sulfurtransferase
VGLRDDQIRRYSRHVLLPDVGGVGQARWLAGAVVIERLDEAGQVAALYLAAAGVGTLVVRDRGSVDAPGALFQVGDVGASRLAAAERRVAELNPDARVVADGDGVPVRTAPGHDAVSALASGAAAARWALAELRA